MNFLMIDGALLRNKQINPTMKLIISYLYNLGKHGKAYFGGYQYMADILGISEKNFTQNMASLVSAGFVVQTSEGLILGRDLNFFSTFSREDLNEGK